MSAHTILSVCIAGLLPTLAWSGVPHAAEPAADTALPVLPLAVGDPPRQPPSLRESLRQGVADDTDQPFRLSAEERQQMREQLRSQSFGDRKRK